MEKECEEEQSLDRKNGEGNKLLEIYQHSLKKSFYCSPSYLFRVNHNFEIRIEISSIFKYKCKGR